MRKGRWSENRVDTLVAWAKDKDASILHRENSYNEIAKIIGKTARSCYDKILYMEKKEALNQEMTMDDASRIKNMTSGLVIPEDLDLKNLLCDEMVLSFDEALYNGKKFFHMTQVPPHKMVTLNENDCRDNYIHGMNLSNDQLLLIQELDTNSVLLPDKYVRDHYEYRHQNGGVPNPHICEPKTNLSKPKIGTVAYYHVLQIIFSFCRANNFV